MTMAVGVALGIVLGWFCTWLLLRRSGVQVTLTRPTTADGEAVQLTTFLPKSAVASLRLGDVIEQLSKGVQARVVRQNELVAETGARIAWEKWKKIQAKLDQGFKLSRDENRWWQSHGTRFDAQGPKLDTTDAQVRTAALAPEAEE
jgi:hypothetical protein